MEYDILGDIHGHHDALVELLEELGYRFRNGAYRHSSPDRTVIFLGDLIDRGPKQLETLETARRMVDEGTARIVMGNHEHGGIGWFYRNPKEPSQYLRQHGSKNLDQHKVFLASVEHDRELHREWVEWMRTIPVFLETPEIRCIHACWHPQHIDAVRQFTDENGVMTEEGLFASYDKQDPLRTTIDILIRGPEVDLPDGYGFHDHAGHYRTQSRVRWWDESASSLLTGAITDHDAIEGLPDVPLEGDSLVQDDDPRPVFFGHYWMGGDPVLLGTKKTCLDFSVAKPGGVLCSYTWRGESELTDENLHWVGRPRFKLTA
jgi:hypothetical protein